MTALPYFSVRSPTAVSNCLIRSAVVNASVPIFCISSVAISPTIRATSPTSAAAIDMPSKRLRNSIADMPRLSRINGDFRPIPMTMELTRKSTDSPVSLARRRANSNNWPNCSNGILKLAARTAPFINSNSVTVPRVAFFRPSNNLGSPILSNALRIPSPSAANLDASFVNPTMRSTANAAATAPPIFFNPFSRPLALSFTFSKSFCAMPVAFSISLM